MDGLARFGIEKSRFTLRGPNRPAEKPKEPKHRRSAKQVGVTVSIGAAQRASLETKPAEVVKAADKALYKAKKAGRNQIKA